MKMHNTRKIYRLKNRVKILKQLKKYSKKYYTDNKDKILKYAEEYRKKHRIEIRKRSRKYYLKHKTSYKIYLNEHKPQRIKTQKRYRKNHATQINAHRNNRLKFDTDFKLRYYLSCRIRKAIKGLNKSKTTLKLLGCSIKTVRKHIESQFKSGMSWSNYGYYGWHIDHIIPCSSFDLSKPSEQKKCFHYTNLQPLWAKDNMQKGNRL